MRSVLASNRVTQYYVQTFPTYDINAASEDGTVYWQSSTVDANSQTGYFYNISGSYNLSIPIGTYSTRNVKYVTTGALIKFDAPAGYVFDENNRLVALTRSVAPTDITYIWTTVLNVVGDGYNNGQGNFANGTGPVVLNGYVPTGAILVTVLPAFANTLPNAVVQDCITRMELQLDFSLIFDNSLTVAEDRWMVKQYETPNWFVNFKSTGSNNYIITYRSLAYYFGSVADTRF